MPSRGAFQPPPVYDSVATLKDTLILPRLEQSGSLVEILSLGFCYEDRFRIKTPQRLTDKE